jgi:hypothetical protein
MCRPFRRWYAWVLVLLVAAAGYGVHRATRPPWADGEAGQKYRKVYLGMPEAELREVFGDRDYAGWADEQGHTWPTFLSWRRPYGLDWQFGPDDLHVQLGRDGKVCQKSATIRGHTLFESSDPEGEPSWWDRLQAKLGW